MRTDPTLCCGWRSIWCVLDKLLGCHVKLICDLHDASIWRAFDDLHPAVSS